MNLNLRGLATVLETLTFVIILFGKQRDREFIHVLVHSQGMARPESEARISISISHMGSRGHYIILLAALQGVHLWEAGSEVGQCCGTIG